MRLEDHRTSRWKPVSFSTPCCLFTSDDYFNLKSWTCERMSNNNTNWTVICQKPPLKAPSSRLINQALAKARSRLNEIILRTKHFHFLRNFNFFVTKIPPSPQLDLVTLTTLYASKVTKSHQVSQDKISAGFVVTRGWMQIIKSHRTLSREALLFLKYLLWHLAALI